MKRKIQAVLMGVFIVFGLTGCGSVKERDF